ncbi:hypothetical protein AVEN_160083-1 [Araneus ventricosus]|uniref:Uncharacterized protein n=1 Tax=Araneus ventricosus TaxID=182803 RepID=A0A4Y2GJY5_ARAVE|nr:hypothetical protein AVEN_160083-1 [Araneus ventricosus]
MPRYSKECRISCTAGNKYRIKRTKGPGGLMVRSRHRGRRFPDSKSDSIEELSYNREENIVLTGNYLHQADLEFIQEEEDTLIDVYGIDNRGINCGNLWNKSYNSSEINVQVCKSDHLNQETFTKPTASDEHNRRKLDFFPSYAITSGEFLPLVSPASNHHKNVIISNDHIIRKLQVRNQIPSIAQVNNTKIGFNKYQQM